MAAAKQVILSASMMMSSYRVSAESFEKLVNAVNAVESK